MNNAGAGQYGRFLTSMNLGESFIDTTEVLKMRCSMYRCGALSGQIDDQVRLYQTARSSSSLPQIKGRDQTGNTAYTSNPNEVIRTGGTSDDFGTSETHATFFTLRFGDGGNDFGSVSGVNTFIVASGYLYKKATSSNPFATAVQNATRSMWSLGVRHDDDVRIYVNGRLVFAAEYQNQQYHYGFFTLDGDFAYIHAEMSNGSGGAYLNMKINCLGVQ